MKWRKQSRTSGTPHRLAIYGWKQAIEAAPRVAELLAPEPGKRAEVELRSPNNDENSSLSGRARLNEGTKK